MSGRRPIGRGQIDLANRHRVSGWSIRANGEGHDVVEILVDGVRVGTSEASQYREDLRDAGFSDGRHGFEFQFPQAVGIGHAVIVRVRSLSSGEFLTPGPKRIGPHGEPTTHSWALLFMHIPKTAGTAVRLALQDVYRPEERTFLYDEPPGISVQDFRARPAEDRAAARLIFGHFHYGLHEAIPGPSRYVTIVREPVDRIVSLYHMHARLGQAVGLSLTDWLTALRLRDVDNAMVRHISGRPRVPFGECPDDLLDEALLHIDEDFAAVLVQEEMERSLAVLEQVIAARLPEMGRENVNPTQVTREPIGPDVLARIEDLNRLDITLYRRARESLMKSDIKGD